MRIRRRLGPACGGALLCAVGLVSCTSGRSGSAARPEPSTTIAVLAPGATLPPGEPRLWDLSIHCGARVLSWRFNGIWWKTDEATDELDWVPDGWPHPSETGGVTVIVQLSSDARTLSVTYAGKSVIYKPAELERGDLCA